MKNFIKYFLCMTLLTTNTLFSRDGKGKKAVAASSLSSHSTPYHPRPEDFYPFGVIASKTPSYGFSHGFSRGCPPAESYQVYGMPGYTSCPPAYPTPPRVRYTPGEYPLHDAIWNGHINHAVRLFDSGDPADVLTLKNTFGNTILHQSLKRLQRALISREEAIIPTLVNFTKQILTTADALYEGGSAAYILLNNHIGTKPMDLVETAQEIFNTYRFQEYPSCAELIPFFNPGRDATSERAVDEDEDEDEEAAHKPQPAPAPSPTVKLDVVVEPLVRKDEPKDAADVESNPREASPTPTPSPTVPRVATSASVWHSKPPAVTTPAKPLRLTKATQPKPQSPLPLTKKGSSSSPAKHSSTRGRGEKPSTKPSKVSQKPPVDYDDFYEGATSAPLSMPRPSETAKSRSGFALLAAVDDTNDESVKSIPEEPRGVLVTAPPLQAACGSECPFTMLKENKAKPFRKWLQKHRPAVEAPLHEDKTGFTLLRYALHLLQNKVHCSDNFIQMLVTHSSVFILQKGSDGTSALDFVCTLAAGDPFYEQANSFMREWSCYVPDTTEIFDPETCSYKSLVKLIESRNLPAKAVTVPPIAKKTRKDLERERRMVATAAPQTPMSAEDIAALHRRLAELELVERAKTIADGLTSITDKDRDHPEQVMLVQNRVCDDSSRVLSRIIRFNNVEEFNRSPESFRDFRCNNTEVRDIELPTSGIPLGDFPFFGALATAINMCNFEMIEAILPHIEDLNEPVIPQTRQTFLHTVCNRNFYSAPWSAEDIYRLAHLLCRHPSVTAASFVTRDAFGRTPLHYAARLKTNPFFGGVHASNVVKLFITNNPAAAMIACDDENLASLAIDEAIATSNHPDVIYELFKALPQLERLRVCTMYAASKTFQGTVSSYPQIVKSTPKVEGARCAETLFLEDLEIPLDITQLHGPLKSTGFSLSQTDRETGEKTTHTVFADIPSSCNPSGFKGQQYLVRHILQNDISHLLQGKMLTIAQKLKTSDYLNRDPYWEPYLHALYIAIESGAEHNVQCLLPLWTEISRIHAFDRRKLNPLKIGIRRGNAAIAALVVFAKPELLCSLTYDELTTILPGALISSFDYDGSIQNLLSYAMIHRSEYGANFIKRLIQIIPLDTWLTNLPLATSSKEELEVAVLLVTTTESTTE